MEPCKGIGNWLECLKCPLLCKKECPIESDNVMEEVRKQIYNSSPDRKTEERIPIENASEGIRNSQQTEGVSWKE